MIKDMYEIYLIENLINGKKYIGSHVCRNRRGDYYLGSGKLILAALKKYGKENFRKTILEKCNLNEVLEKETAWIQDENSLIPYGYNIHPNGGSNFKGSSGLSHDEKTRTIISETKKSQYILGIMNNSLQTYRTEMSAFAPRILTIRIPTDKIRDVIGKGGVTIRALTEETGTVVDITDDGEVKVAAADLAACEEAIRRIEMLTADVAIGGCYDGTVVKLMDFGAIVNFLPGKQGLVHISQIANERIAKVEDKLSEGQAVRVKVLEIDRQGRIRLSMKEVE